LCFIYQTANAELISAAAEVDVEQEVNAFTADWYGLS